MNLALTLGLVAFTALCARPESADAQGVPHYFPVNDIKWTDGPATLPKGVKVAVLEGDPKVDGVFTMRLKFPAGTVVMPHSHSQTEHATVMAGTLHIGMGDKFDKVATRPMPAGSFGYWPIGMNHFAWMEGETILQLHGKGPWTVKYVNPADDPSHAAKKP